MRAYSKRFSMQPFQEKTFYIQLQKDESIVAAYCPGTAHYKIWKDDVLYSEKRAKKTGGMIVQAGDHWIPVFSTPGRTVEINVKTFDYSLEDKISFLIATQEELKSLLDPAKEEWMVGIDDFGKSMTTGDNIVLFENKYDFDVFVIALFNFGTAAEASEYQLYLDTEKILDFHFEMLNFRGPDKPIPIYTFVPPGSKLLWKIKDAWSMDYCNAEILLSKHKIELKDDPLFNLLDPFSLPLIDGVINIFEDLTPAPVPEPAPGSDTIPPYPSDPGEDDTLEPTIPDEYPPDISDLQKSIVIPYSAKINNPEEQLVVEPLISPFGAVRKNADVRGRQRITTAAISYRSGKLVVSDTSEYTLLQNVVGKNISFYAKQGEWEIKILPLYDKLSGKSINDMNVIYLDEGSAFDEHIEVVEIKVKCTTAEGGSQGILFWYLGI